jgi:SNF2 family DNA or RNA helicase
MQRVQVLLKSLMLRRQKDSLVDGQIVCNLPPKHLSKEAVEFSDDEMVVYKALENKAQITLNKYIKDDRVSGKQPTTFSHAYFVSDIFVQPITRTSSCFFSASGKHAATHI